MINHTTETQSSAIANQQILAINADQPITQPSWLTPKFQNIPSVLKKQPWAVWKAKPRDGKPGKYEKAPLNPNTGRNVGANKPETFGTYEEAERAYLSGKYTGIGVLLTGSGIVGVDIDDYKSVFAANQAIKNWVLSAVASGVYCELSPSGTGLRLFMYGQLNGSGRKHNNLEIYDTGRFLTVTGHCARMPVPRGDE